MQKKYESMIVIAPNFSEEDAKKENEKIHSSIKKLGGEVQNTDEWGKKQLAYEILDFKEGYYFINYYNFEPAKTSELERTFKLNENIIRYNILLKS